MDKAWLEALNKIKDFQQALYKITGKNLVR